MKKTHAVIGALQIDPMPPSYPAALVRESVRAEALLKRMRARSPGGDQSTRAVSPSPSAVRRTRAHSA